MPATRPKVSLLASALAAAALALALPLPAWAQNGGAPAPDAGAEAGSVDPAFVLSSRRSLPVGAALRIRGSAPNAAGRAIRLERHDAALGWVAIATVQADAAGAFSTTWQPPATGRYLLRGVVDDAASAAQDGGPPTSVPRTVTVYRRALATVYGPGFYGRRTACGTRLTTRTLGVAHRRLACGTRVAILHRGRSLVVPVIDRGPYANGASWDLTMATAERLGVPGTTRIGVAVVAP